MSVMEIVQSSRPRIRHVYGLTGLALAILIIRAPAYALEVAQFVTLGLIHVAPLVVPGILLAAWITASGASRHVAKVFHGRPVYTVIGATVVGAFLPVCGVTVLPLMAGLLAAGVPLAPVMAFWLASPITGPALLSATAATLGWEFAIGKALAAIGLGLFGGGMTALFANQTWSKSPLRTNKIVGSLGGQCVAGKTCGLDFDLRFWRDPFRRQQFLRECWSITRMILLVLAPAFAAEHILNDWLEPNAVADYVGRDSAFAVPLAVIVGGPAYIDGYAALPLTRALLEHGMSSSAAMAFLVSGGVVSIWGAMAIFPVLKLKPFLLYLVLAAVGSMISGWVFGAFF
ncbi:permease [Ruegeria meonggei]|uniref:Putative permease n=1 Tax=Ruegeria meonggei TaxID=1446476 RepID=A0A1X6YWX7_9RHOB|nr:permease [Ruegeria meonggei]SLN33608.1 putative permease [Ruegeria meonggei]